VKPGRNGITYGAMITFDTTYGQLPERFFTRMPPTPVAQPDWIAFNAPLAERLGLDGDALAGDTGLQLFAGNSVPDGADPLAQVYAGHQFGNFVPQLGDGRALLLGEVVAPDGARFDLQLKGSGPTPYSRNGDGRAWLGPVLREYIMSEAMAALGVPTTRALAAVTTGDRVQREAAFPGAVLTRVASSHIRVGTFQYFVARNDRDGLEALAAHAMARHYPDAENALDLFKGVIHAQARLIARWMSVGFVHGVMNTDNMTISGETIDYGPCAYVDSYHPMRVFSSIDHQGRYAYARQPDIGLWNLAQLGTALMPLIEDLEAAQAALDGFAPVFQAEWLRLFRAKLGLCAEEDGDGDLIQALLSAMADGQADFTNTFRALGTKAARDEFLDPEAFDKWQGDWRDRLARENTTPEARVETLWSNNPAVIARTHRIEQAIQAALGGDFTPFQKLNAALSSPFGLAEENAFLARQPTEEEIVPRTFCGT